MGAVINAGQERTTVRFNRVSQRRRPRDDKDEPLRIQRLLYWVATDSHTCINTYLYIIYIEYIYHKREKNSFTNY